MVPESRVALPTVSRRLWTTQALALHALLAVVLVSFGWLGFWQLQRFEERARGPVVEKPGPAVALADVMAPGAELSEAGVGRLVEVRGEYVPGAQLLLPDRELDGRQGFWLLAP